MQSINKVKNFLLTRSLHKKYILISSVLTCSLLTCVSKNAFASSSEKDNSSKHNYKALLELSNDSIKQQSRFLKLHGIGSYPSTSKIENENYIVPHFYKYNQFRTDQPEIAVINANGTGSSTLTLPVKIDTLPVVCAQTKSSLSINMPFTNKKRKIESQYTINTSAVAFSVKGGDGKNYDYFHITQDHNLVPFSQIFGNKKILANPIYRAKMHEVIAEPIPFNANNNWEDSIVIAKSSPGTTAGSTEVTNSIELSLGTELNLGPNPTAKQNAGFKFGRQEKFTIQDVSIRNEVGRNGNQAVWKYAIGNIRLKDRETSQPSVGGVLSSVQWIWRIDREAAIKNGLYNPLEKNHYTFSFENKVKSSFKVYRGKNEPLTIKFKETDLVEFDNITFLVPPAAKENSKLSSILIL